MEHDHYDNHQSHEHYTEYIKLDEDGLANDVEQLRAITHDLVGVIDFLLSHPGIKLILPPDVYTHIEMMLISAHSVVCKTAADALTEVLEGLIARGEITPTEEHDDEEGERRLQVISSEDRARADSILRQVFGNQKEA